MQQIQYSVNDRIAFITMNRPGKRNALSRELINELTQSFTTAETDPAVKVIILKANGDAFSAGADLAALQKMQSYTYEENLADSNHLRALFQKIYSLKKVVIAQVQGHALAGGCGLASVCDFAFAVPEAKFGYTEVRIGFVPALVMVFLIRKIGEHHARQLLLSGHLIKAGEAERIGIVSRVVAAENLESEVLAFAAGLVRTNSLSSMEITKQMIANVQSLSLSDALDYASRMNAQARGTDDCKKGVAAFLNKQDLSW